MRMTRLGTALLFLAACGCTPVDYGFGETHRQNIALQVVDPDPQYVGEEIEGGSGERSADAVDRYNRGEVRQPASVNTTATSSSSSGASTPGSSGQPQG